MPSPRERDIEDAIEQAAALARVRLAPGDRPAAASDLRRLLVMVERLEELALRLEEDAVPPTYLVAPDIAPLRDDRPVSPRADDAADALAQAPTVRDDRVAVPCAL